VEGKNNNNDTSSSSEEEERQQEHIDEVNVQGQDQVEEIGEERARSHDAQEESDADIQPLIRKKKGKQLMDQPSQSTESEVQSSLLFAYKDHIASTIWNSLVCPYCFYFMYKSSD